MFLRIQRRDTRAVLMHAHTAMFDHVSIDAYGNRTSLSQVAQVTIKSPTLAVLNVFDPMVRYPHLSLTISTSPKPQLASKVAEAIRDSGMNLNPTVETNSVVVPIPKYVNAPLVPPGALANHHMTSRLKGRAKRPAMRW